MKTIKIIFLYIFFGLSFLVRGQQIGNYVSNGSFESIPNCSIAAISDADFWNAIDSVDWWQTGQINITCGGSVPIGPGGGFQYPRTGKNYGHITTYCKYCGFDNQRYMPKNRLKRPLLAGHSYCVQMWVSLKEGSSVASDALQILLADNSVDTIKYGAVPLTYLSPQISYAVGNPISDTLNWVAVNGTFTANGTEKYLILGNFKTDTLTSLTTITIDTTGSPDWCEYWVDDVSVIEFNLPAFAGPDKFISSGDSVFIGRQPDWAIDPGCIWYKLPNMVASIDTISGLWVKPTATSTYVVRQQLDCSSLKWDTVVVNMNLAGLDKLQNLSDNINLFPNPTSGNLSISGFIGADITTFSISNCLGQNVLNDDIIKKNNLITIEISELESGLYQIHLKTQYGIVTKKFVKTN